MYTVSATIENCMLCPGDKFCRNVEWQNAALMTTIYFLLKWMKRNLTSVLLVCGNTLVEALNRDRLCTCCLMSVMGLVVQAVALVVASVLCMDHTSWLLGIFQWSQVSDGLWHKDHDHNILDLLILTCLHDHDCNNSLDYNCRINQLSSCITVNTSTINLCSYSVNIVG